MSGNRVWLLAVIGIAFFSGCRWQSNEENVSSTFTHEFRKPVDAIYVSDQQVVSYKFVNSRTIEFEATKPGICLVELRMGRRSEAYLIHVSKDLAITTRWIDMSSRVWVEFSGEEKGREQE